MTEHEPAPDDNAAPDGDQGRSAAPFLAALAIFVLAIIGFVIFRVVSPGENYVTDAEGISDAVHAFAAGSTDPGGPTAVCPGFDVENSPLGGHAGDEDGGKSVEVIEVKDPQAEGDRATAEVTTKVDDHEATATWNLVRSGDGWVVCNR